MTVDSVDDGDDNNETPTVTVAVNDGSSDDAWDLLADGTVSVTVTDDDGPGVLVNVTDNMSLFVGFMLLSLSIGVAKFSSDRPQA